jgi:hypothetical protein
MYIYNGFCILSILWKLKEENIDVHEYWVLYSQYFVETKRRKHTCTLILGSVFSAFSLSRKMKHRCTCILGSVFSAFSGNRAENIDVHVYWVLYSQHSLKHKEENIDVHV